MRDERSKNRGQELDDILALDYLPMNPPRKWKLPIWTGQWLDPMNNTWRTARTPEHSSQYNIGITKYGSRSLKQNSPRLGGTSATCKEDDAYNHAIRRTDSCDPLKCLGAAH